MLVGDRNRGFGLKRGNTGEHLVEGNAEGVEIRPAIEGLALRLLRREVRSGTHDGAVLGERSLRPTNESRRDPEVSNLHIAGIRDEDVAELHISVNKTSGVGGREGSGDVSGDLCGPISVERTGAAQYVRHRAPRHMLHHDVVRAPLLTPVIDTDDVGVVEVGGGLRLTAETLHKVRIVRELGEEHLEGDLTPQEFVARQIDVGHTAASDVTQQLVAAIEDGGSLLGHSRRVYRSTRNARLHPANRSIIS